MQRVIGTDQPHGRGYAQLFSVLPFDRYRVKQIGNLYPRVAKLCKRLHIKTLPHPLSVSIPRRAAGADLLHFWNKINLGDHPRVASLEGAAFDDIMNDTNSIRDKGVKALARIRDKHDPLKRAVEMQLIYDAALSGRGRPADAA